MTDPLALDPVLPVKQRSERPWNDDLPHDEDLYRIVQGGLHGTAMLPWDIPKVELEKIVQYIKTFAPQRWEKKKKNGEPVKTLDPFEITEDPWKGKEAEGIQKGKELYHLRAECLNCHPSYETKKDLYELSVAASKREPDKYMRVLGILKTLRAIPFSELLVMFVVPFDREVLREHIGQAMSHLGNRPGSRGTWQGVIWTHLDRAELRNAEGMLAFLDPFALSYPGFLIAGDRATLDFGSCGCGRSGAFVEGEIERAPGAEVRGCGGVLGSILA